MGDRQQHFAFALDALNALAHTSVLKVSSYYETEPLTGPGVPTDQGMFLNAAALLATDLEPHDLLEAMLAIELQAGRPTRDEREHWGPRPLDLDLLLYDQRIIASPTLTVPHPHMLERRFVMEPLNEIAGDWLISSPKKDISRTVQEAFQSRFGKPLNH